MSTVPAGSPAQESAPSGTGPGHLLRAAREGAGISVREVSAQLRLDERTVVALESDDFRDLPAPTFVRGYLRGYARLLGVPVGPVMEAYNREGFTPPDLVADIAETPDASAGDVPVRLATIAVVAVLVILVVLWWNNQAFNQLPEPIADSGEPPAAAGDSGLPPPAPAAEIAAPFVQDGGPVPRDESGGERTADGDSVIAPVGDSTADSAAQSDATAQSGSAPAAADAAQAPPPAEDVTEVISRAEGVLQRTRSEVNAITASEPGAATPAAEAGAAADQSPEVAAADGAPAPATAESPADAASAAQPTGAGGTGRLQMNFPIEAWVEVYDRNDARLFYDLAKPGRLVDVSGEVPIRVLLGRTRGVTVEFNGEKVDIAPFIDRGVARFTLGE